MADDNLIRFGWEEWVALPDLGLPALRAKVDTGARTSALHAWDIETFGPVSKPRVRFTVHPIPGREDVVIPCSAVILDRRTVTSSNGESESRYVIASTLRVADHSWRIELTLTNRATMASRMLLGREALKDHITI
ncbi:MAG: ATP-dependent zinc protease, partial [Rhodosalinus sp.]